MIKIFRLSRVMGLHHTRIIFRLTNPKTRAGSLFSSTLIRNGDGSVRWSRVILRISKLRRNSVWRSGTWSACRCPLMMSKERKTIRIRRMTSKERKTIQKISGSALKVAMNLLYMRRPRILGMIWSKNSTKTHQNRKFKLYHVFTTLTFLLENVDFLEVFWTLWYRRVFTLRHDLDNAKTGSERHSAIKIPSSAEDGRQSAEPSRQSRFAGPQFTADCDKLVSGASFVPTVDGDKRLGEPFVDNPDRDDVTHQT